MNASHASPSEVASSRTPSTFQSRRRNITSAAMRVSFFLVFAAGIGNTVLRPEVGHPYTLYRLLAPLALLAALSARPIVTLRWLTLFLAFTVYNIALAVNYGGGFSELWASIVHYLYIFILLVLYVDMKWRHPTFDRQFTRFIWRFYAFLLISIVVELIIGSPIYPNVLPDEAGEPAVRAFFWNQNDLAVVLCIITWFALTLDGLRTSARFAVLATTVAILYYNDSKAALISLALVSIPVHIILQVCSRTRVSPKFWFLLFGAIFAITAAAIFTAKDTPIEFGNSYYTLGDLLVKPIGMILSLESSGEEWGSLNNRTDAAIFNIIEYLKTFGFGLGAGGSWLVLTMPQYQLGGALSPHNALLQFTVDFGYPVLIGYIYMTFWALRKLFTHGNSQGDKLKVMAALSFPLVGLSQSGAIVTNYFFWVSVFFIWLFERNAPDLNQSSGRKRARRMRSASYESPAPVGR